MLVVLFSKFLNILYIYYYIQKWISPSNQWNLNLSIKKNEWAVSDSLFKTLSQIKNSLELHWFWKLAIEKMKWVLVQFGIVNFLVFWPVRINRTVKLDIFIIVKIELASETWYRDCYCFSFQKAVGTRR